MARVERESHPCPPTGAGRFGSTLIHPTVGPRAGPSSSATPMTAAPISEKPATGIEPTFHWSGARMVGPAGQGHDVMADPGNRINHTDRQAILLQDRPLFDVNLNPSLDVGPGRLPGCAAG